MNKSRSPKAFRRRKDPKTAAASYRDLKYTTLCDASNQKKFRLSGDCRVTFVLDGRTLERVQVGGHT